MWSGEKTKRRERLGAKEDEEERKWQMRRLERAEERRAKADAAKVKRAEEARDAEGRGGIESVRRALLLHLRRRVSA